MNTDSHPRQTVVFFNDSFAALRFGSSLGGAHHPVNSYLVITPLGRVLIDPAEDADTGLQQRRFLDRRRGKDAPTGAANRRVIPRSLAGL